MKLPEVKKKKLIDEKKMVKLAKKVQESFEEELKYLYEKKIKDENYLST